VFLEKSASIFMQGPLRWGSELEPSLLLLIRAIGYTKMLLYAIFLSKNKKLFKIKKFTGAP